MSLRPPGRVIPERALRWILAVALIAILYRALTYYFGSGLPWAFERDLGFDFWNTEYIRALVHTKIDFYDAMGWSIWFDIPQFFYNSLFPYAFTTPLAYLTHDSWQAIKLLEILLLVVAGAGTYGLMRAFGRPPVWSLFAAIAYACVPPVSLNEHFGLSVAIPAMLLPACFWGSVVLVRKFGAASLPFCAVICCFAGTVPHVEYLFLLTGPAYVIVAAYALGRRHERGDWIYAIAGLPFLVLPAFYYIVPTALQTPIGESARRVDEVQGQTFLAYFSETAFELFALVPRTHLLDPEPVTNVSQFLLLAAIAGGILWWLAAVPLPKLGSASRRVIFAVVALLLFLSLGPNAPFGTYLWEMLAKIPTLGALRTPDRFLPIPVLFIVVAAVDRLRTFAKRPPVLSRDSVAIAIGAFAVGLAVTTYVDRTILASLSLASPALVLVFNVVEIGMRVCAFTLLACAIGTHFVLRHESERAIYATVLSTLLIVLMLGFAALSHIWENERDIGALEPHLAQVNSIVADLDHRTTSLAIARRGSAIDGATYGVPVPTMLSAWELGTRFGTDGIGGLGVLGRTGFASVIATDDWARDYQHTGFNFATLYRDVPLGHNVFDSKAVLVKAIDSPDPAITYSQAVCLQGGPGLIDHLLALPQMRGIDFLTPRPQCSTAMYQNFDGRNWIQPTQTIAWQPGSTLCPQCLRLRDADFIVPPERFALRQPWYRNSIDGDTPTLDPGGVAQITDGTGTFERDLSLALPSFLPGRARLVMRYAAHDYTVLTYAFPGGQQNSVRLLPSHGLRWLTLPLPAVACQGSPCTLKIHVRTAPQNVDRMGYRWYGFALDGIVAIDESLLHKAIVAGGPGAVAVPSDAFERDLDPFYHEYHIVSRTPWAGPTGNYVVAVRADVPRGGKLSFTVPGTSVSGSVTVPQAPPGAPPPPPTTLTVPAHLRPGQILFTAVTDEENRPLAHDVPVQVRAIAREPAISLYDLGPGVQGGDLQFREGPETLSQVQLTHQVPDGAFGPDGITGHTGTYLKIRVPGSRQPTTYSAGVQDLAGPGTLQLALYCGKSLATQVFTIADTRNLLGLTATSPNCTLYATWYGTLTVGHVFLYATQGGTSRLQRSLWLPAGSYRVAPYDYDLTPTVVPLDLRIDGRPAGTIAHVRSTGYHRVALTTTGAKTAFYVFTPIRGPFAVKPQTLAFDQTGAIRYAFTLGKRSGIKTNHLNDGYWTLVGNGSAITGQTCNLLDTCFPSVPPGTYQLMHQWSAALKAGLFVSVASVLAAPTFILWAYLWGLLRRRAPGRLEGQGVA